MLIEDKIKLSLRKLIDELSLNKELILSKTYDISCFVFFDISVEQDKFKVKMKNCEDKSIIGTLTHAVDFYTGAIDSNGVVAGNFIYRSLKRLITEEELVLRFCNNSFKFQIIIKQIETAPNNKETVEKSTNQAKFSNVPIVHNGLRYRSKTETIISNALESEGCLFYPNNACRIKDNNGRYINKESDFLVCHKTNWGILEVDGEMWHTSAAKDHARDDLFNAHGIWFIKRYPASECWESPNKVVRHFLSRMEQFYSQ